MKKLYYKIYNYLQEIHRFWFNVTNGLWEVKPCARCKKYFWFNTNGIKDQWYVCTKCEENLNKEVEMFTPTPLNPKLLK